MRTIGLIMASTLMLGTALSADARGVPVVKRAMAVIHAADGAERGRAKLVAVGGALRVTVTGVGLSTGDHGLHIHSVGLCDAPDFKTAGAHWNPTMKMHGRNNPMGAHSGDLPSLTIGANGRGSVTFNVPGTVASLIDADGASIVVHAAADDYATDPSGNSGGRIACGVFVAR